MIKKVKTNELFDCKVEYLQELFNSCEYPWEMLPKIKDVLTEEYEHGEVTDDGIITRFNFFLNDLDSQIDILDIFQLNTNLSYCTYRWTSNYWS